MPDFNNNPHVGSPLGAYPAVTSGTDTTSLDCQEECVLPCDTLVNAAADDAQFTVDGQTVVSRPLADLVALDKHLKSRKSLCNSSGNAWGAVAKSRVVFPSAAGDN